MNHKLSSFESYRASRRPSAEQLNTETSIYEIHKNALLTAVYENNSGAAQKICTELIRHAEKDDYLTENSEKRLNQIVLIIKRFSSVFPDKGERSAEAMIKRLKRRILISLKSGSSQTGIVEYNTWQKKTGLTDRQLPILFKTAMTFQLSKGCSNFCRRCNEWALPKVRAHFSYDAVCTFLDQMIQHKNPEISLYGASDPLDWEDQGRTVSDIIQYLSETSIDYSLLTKVPRKKTWLLKTLVQGNANISASVTAKNKARIQKAEQNIAHSLAKQHETDDLLIPAGLDEDFVSIKPSITDGYGTEITPDGAFIVIPTFTSALYPFGHKKIKITGRTDFFPLKRTGRHALLVDYFKPLQGYTLQGKPAILDQLLDVQTESILLDNGSDDLTPPGMRSLKEYLSIFDDKARLKRKQMTPSVVKRLKREWLSNCSFKSLPDPDRQIYLEKLNTHLILSSKKKCSELKLFALSFFLEAVLMYIKKPEANTGILKFLLADETQKISTDFKSGTLSGTPDHVFTDPKRDAFKVFRYFCLNLVRHREITDIEAFIKKYPSGYDPVADIFVNRFTNPV